MEEIDNKAEKRKDADIMKKYKAVFSDIDGTLLNSKHQIPENTRKKIKQINQNGIPYVLVSARMPKGMTAIRAELEAKSPMICYSGALVVDEEDHPIYSVAMPQEVAMKLCRRVYELNPKKCLLKMKKSTKKYTRCYAWEIKKILQRWNNS